MPAVECCIAGGGPAGVMLGYLLARAGVAVSVLEKHADFLRDFRGDTVHPSTLEVLEEGGLLEQFERLPQRRVRRLGVLVGGRLQEVIDFRGLKPFDYMSLVPQWDFLDFLAGEGRRRFLHFDLRMSHEALGLIEHAGRVAGVRVRSPGGDTQIRAEVVVACDGGGERVSEIEDPAASSGGSGMIGLQEMLMQVDGKEILLMPAWPADWDVDFELTFCNL